MITIISCNSALSGIRLQRDRREDMILMNRLGTMSKYSAPENYAGNVIETVKVAILTVPEVEQDSRTRRRQRGTDPRSEPSQH